MEVQGGGELFQIIFLMLTQIPLALVVYGWGKRMEPKSRLPVILTLIPGFGYLYFYWFTYKTTHYVSVKAAEK